MTKTSAQLDREVREFMADPEAARLVANDAEMAGHHAAARSLRGKAGITVGGKDIARMASRSPNEWVQIFDRLKPGQIIYLAMTAVMGMNRAESGDYVAHKVGRRSVPKRPQWWTEAISLIPADGSKANKFSQYKLWKRKSGGLSVSSGDMAGEIQGIYAPMGKG